MEKISIKGIGYFLPECVGDVQELIKMALAQGREIRIRGAYHSVPAAIVPDTAGIYVMLAKMNRVCINTNAGPATVTVEAGCHLDYDPRDPTKISTKTNGLFKKLDAAGFAMPDMGGITHQTIGGFLSTGASGSSIKESFGEMLQSITFIPANSNDPQPITVSIDDKQPCLFHAAGVSLGLLGIIVSVTFKVVRKYNIEGKETITSFDDCAIDMSGKGTDPAKSLRFFLTNTRFKRLLWYPQPNVSKVVVWQAGIFNNEKRVAQKKYETPYEGLPIFFGSMLPAQFFVYGIYYLMGNSPEWLAKSRFFKKFIYSHFLPFILNIFVPIKKKPDGTPHAQCFQDFWYSSLPMDNNIRDTLIPVKFTELWVPYNDNDEDDVVAKVLQKLNCVFEKMYKDGGPIPGGDFCVEMVAAKASDFWLSPSYKTNVFRVDIFWFGGNAGSPADTYYPIFWEALAEFNYRCHWGKYLPGENGPQGVEYLKKQYLKWNDFMALRDKYDPNKIFVNDYWKRHLNI